MAQLDQETKRVLDMLESRGISETYQSLEELAQDLQAGKMVAQVGGRGHVLFLRPREEEDYSANAIDFPHSDPRNPTIDMEGRISASFSGTAFSHFMYGNQDRHSGWDCHPMPLWETGRDFKEESKILYMKVEKKQLRSFLPGRID